MKLKSKILSGLVALTLLGCGSLNVISAPIDVTLPENVGNINSVSQFSANQISDDQKNQIASIETFNKLLDGFSTNTMSTYTKSSSSLSYPDDYAGSYLDDEKKLHILVTEEKSIPEYEKIVDDTNVIYEVAKNSLNNLFELQKFTDTFWGQYNIVSTAIVEKDNLLMIGVTDMEFVDVISTILTINGYPSTMYSFEIDSVCQTIENRNAVQELLQSYTATTTYQNAKPGDKFYIRTSETSTPVFKGTIGFQAKIGDVVGIVIVDHCLWYGNYRGTYEANMAADSSCVRRPNYDCAFVPFSLNSFAQSATISNSVYGSESITLGRPATSVPSGTTLTSFGQGSGKTTNITIVSVNKTYGIINSNTGETVICYGGTRASVNGEAYSVGGDSGGPIGYFNDRNQFVIVGLNSATNVANGYSTFTTFSNIKTQLGLTSVIAYS